jgi:uncharacterized protein YndB with AHSA1/START domain
MLGAMHDIVHELDIAAPPQQVFDAVTTQAGIGGWWTTDCFVEPTVDSIGEFAFEGRSVVLRMRIDLLEAPELVHWECIGGPDEWPGTSIAFRIEGRDEFTVLRFWHGGWEFEDGVLPRASFQWARYLDSLRSFCETGTGSPAAG